MDRGLADLLGTDIRDTYNTGRREDTNQVRRMRYGMSDPVLERKEGPSLTELTDTQEAMQRWNQNKVDDEEKAMLRDEKLAPILEVMKKVGMGIDDFKTLIKSVGSNYSESRKEPWE